MDVEHYKKIALILRDEERRLANMPEEYRHMSDEYIEKLSLYWIKRKLNKFKDNLFFALFLLFFLFFSYIVAGVMFTLLSLLFL